MLQPVWRLRWAVRIDERYAFTACHLFPSWNYVSNCGNSLYVCLSSCRSLCSWVLSGSRGDSFKAFVNLVLSYLSFANCGLIWIVSMNSIFHSHSVTTFSSSLVKAGIFLEVSLYCISLNFFLSLALVLFRFANCRCRESLSFRAIFFALTF